MPPVHVGVSPFAQQGLKKKKKNTLKRGNTRGHEKKKKKSWGPESRFQKTEPSEEARVPKKKTKIGEKKI